MLEPIPFAGYIETDDMNKPVAWINYVEHSDFYDLNISGRGIPLYTHPVKELTDEEIEEIGKEYGIKSVYQFAYYEFAKAILKKAQDK